MTVEYVKQIIIDELKSLEDDLQNKDSKWPLTSYYDVYYNDGYNMGIKDGNIKTLEKILKMLQEVK